jgi:multiple sugar transport system permease protein
VVLAVLSIAGTILASSMVAFSFSRLRWPGRDGLFVILLATMMLPGAVTMMPVFLIFRWLGWIDTLMPLWVPAFFGSAFNVFLLRQFFLTIPNDLEDAAKIDGCSYFGIYHRIMLPLVKPALAAITIMTFMGSWNNFMGPLIYISSPLKMPLAYALQLFQTAHGGEPGLLMAASTMMMMPVLVVFFLTQRYFIQGVTLTGLKG